VVSASKPPGPQTAQPLGLAFKNKRRMNRKHLCLLPVEESFLSLTSATFDISSAEANNLSSHFNQEKAMTGVTWWTSTDSFCIILKYRRSNLTVLECFTVVCNIVDSCKLFSVG
jgi:hypothetical protein